MRHQVDICLCTFRRPGLLAEALGSLKGLDWPPGTEGRILVVDNDDTPAAEEVVTRFARHSPVSVRYHHAPGRNISIARNAALTVSDAPLLAFLDDDERVAPGWLTELLTRLDETGADAVLGPVRAIYSPDAPDWMQSAEPHATRPVFVQGEIRSGYTCNVLINRASPRLAGLEFDPALGRSGGEDTAFFTALARAGGRIAYAEDAVVIEDVPADRATLRWLLRRRYRMGQTHGRLVGETRRLPGRLMAAAMAGAKLAYCLGAVLIALRSEPRRNLNLMRAALHVGAVTGALGARPITLYGAAAEGSPA
jgi:succinoglycan biosynthesis protein ExoM